MASFHKQDVGVSRRPGSGVAVDNTLVDFMMRQTKLTESNAALNVELLQMNADLVSFVQCLLGQIDGQNYAAYVQSAGSGQESTTGSHPVSLDDLGGTLEKQMQGLNLTDDDARTLLRYATQKMLTGNMDCVKGLFSFQAAIKVKQNADAERAEAERIVALERTEQEKNAQMLLEKQKQESETLAAKQKNLRAMWAL